MSSRTLSAVHLRSAEIIEHCETLAMSDGPQIPGVASPIGKPMTFGEGIGDPYFELPAGNETREALLDTALGVSG